MGGRVGGWVSGGWVAWVERGIGDGGGGEEETNALILVCILYSCMVYTYVTIHTLGEEYLGGVSVATIDSSLSYEGTHRAGNTIVGLEKEGKTLSIFPPFSLSHSLFFSLYSVYSLSDL